MSTTPKLNDGISVELRVRYCECDPMRVAHHSIYPVWMEMARIELLRCQGRPHHLLEAEGVHFVVARMSMRFRKPARYDDLIRVHVRMDCSGRIKVNHSYDIYRDEQLLAEAQTTLVCVDASGRPRPIPDGTLART